MTAVAPVGPRATAPADVIVLQYANPYRALGIPLIILGGVVTLNVLIAVAVVRAGGDLSGSEYNGSALWSVLGYAVAVGVQNVGSSFPLALALGSTRRTFVLGNLLSSAIQALLVATAAIVLLVIETSTDGWFIGLRLLRSPLLGDGDALVLGGTMLLGVLTALAVGGVFGASWVRFGARGPLLLTAGVLAGGIVLLLLTLPDARAVADAARPWWPAAACAVVIAAALPGQYLFLRRASVR